MLMMLAHTVAAEGFLMCYNREESLKAVAADAHDARPSGTR